MPHRVALFGGLKLLTGMAGVSWSTLALLAMDPDHAKALIAAIGCGSLGVVYLALKEVVPVYVSARKQLKQMSIDLKGMDEKIEATQAQATVKIEANADQIAAMASRADEAERKAEEVAVDAAHAKEEASQAKADLARIRAENTALRDHMIGLLTNVPDLGEAVLIQAGDMKDPVREPQPSKGQP